MLETIRAALTWLSAIHPDLPYALLGLGLFLLVYVVRKAAPALWLGFENRSPVIKHLTEDAGPLVLAVHKAFQALPSVLLGAALPALISGGNWREAAAGAVVGLLPPIMHELAKWAPFLPYRGAVSAAKTPRVPPLGLLLGLLLVGCSRDQLAKELTDHCSKVSLATIVAGCKMRAPECTPGDELCPVYVECKRAVAEWRKCPAGGAP